MSTPWAQAGPWKQIGTVDIPDVFGSPENLIAAPVTGYGLAISDQIQDGDVLVIDTSKQGRDGEVSVVIWHEKAGSCRAVARVWRDNGGVWLVYPGGDIPPKFIAACNDPFIVGVVVGQLRPVAVNN